MRYRLALIIILFNCLHLWGTPSLAQVESAEPRTLLDAAVDHLQAAESFKLSITQAGEPYPLSLTIDGVNIIPATLDVAQAQFIRPNELHISALLHLIIPLSMDIYSLDDRQWLSFPSGAPWFQLPAFEDFDVNRLLAPADGIEYVVANLQDPQIVDDGATIDELTAWHIRARAAGDVVSGLLFGFINPEADVQVDAYINNEDGLLLLIDITMLETAGDPEAETAIWHIRFYDYDAPRDFEAPSP